MIKKAKRLFGGQSYLFFTELSKPVDEIKYRRGTTEIPG
jgi:hypothetical protein